MSPAVVGVSSSLPMAKGAFPLPLIGYTWHSDTHTYVQAKHTMYTVQVIGQGKDSSRYITIMGEPAIYVFFMCS